MILDKRIISFSFSMVGSSRHALKEIRQKNRQLSPAGFTTCFLIPHVSFTEDYGTFS